ncbi:MAG TPA: hypothetical protein VEU51_08590 [Candidatus Acidoferrales bacterium]|nr:hypothetical protein [Candidatus Acidoferrales bacterium]
MNDRHTNRLAAIAAIGGATLLTVGTYFHPMSADPNVPLAAFTEYAADQHWVASHLTQLAGVALMVAALALFSRMMATGPADVAASLGKVFAVASLAVAGALQAVDGVALRAMVNAWAATPEPSRQMLFVAAFAVRQIEIGLASIGSLLFGITAALYGIAILIDSRRFPRWLGLVAIGGGVPTAISGVAIAYTGFSGLEMAINMPSSIVILLWMVAMGVYSWRMAPA